MIQTIEESKMLKNVTVGSKIKFQYIDKNTDWETVPAVTQYIVKDYEGQVVAIRDTVKNPVSYQTIIRKPALERSPIMLTVQLPNGQIKAFYDGKIVNAKTVNKSFISRLVDKLTGK
jgi:hypothetical protein